MSLIDNRAFSFYAYDETLSDEDIFKYIDESYQLTQTIHTKTKKDVIQ